MLGRDQLTAGAATTRVGGGAAALYWGPVECGPVRVWVAGPPGRTSCHCRLGVCYWGPGVTFTRTGAASTRIGVKGLLQDLGPGHGSCAGRGGPGDGVAEAGRGSDSRGMPVWHPAEPD